MIRNYTYLTFTNFVYIRVKGLVWCFNGLTNPNNIDKNTGDAINEIYVEIENTKPIVIDCKEISGLTDHSWDELFKSVQSIKREIHFINIQKIEQKISSSKNEFCGSMKILNESTGSAIFHINKELTFTPNITEKINDHLLKKIKKYINESFHPYPDGKMQMLTSTPVYSNGEFDAASILSNPESFYWTSLLMADEVEKIIQEFRIGGLSNYAKLLTVSLRASPLAAAIGLLLGLRIETVDHFGPITRHYETDTSTHEMCHYIYIGDFVVGGTEIKISKTYALMKDSKLNHAVVLASLFKQDNYKEFHLHSLAFLKDCAEVKYSLEPS